MIISEGRLNFDFCEDYNPVKFDDTKFYRNYFNNQPGGKGVDIVASSNEVLHLIEIKDFTGNIQDNLWRVATNNSCKDKAPQNCFGEVRDSLDIEVAKKVSSTIACLYGAWSKSNCESAILLEPYYDNMFSKDVRNFKKKILVTLFMEGNFTIGKSKVRETKAIMRDIAGSIKKKLSWLNCIVTVVNTDTYNERFFKVS